MHIYYLSTRYAWLMDILRVENVLFTDKTS